MAWDIFYYSPRKKRKHLPRSSGLEGNFPSSTLLVASVTTLAPQNGSPIVAGRGGASIAGGSPHAMWHFGLSALVLLEKSHWMTSLPQACFVFVLKYFFIIESIWWFIAISWQKYSTSGTLDYRDQEDAKNDCILRNSSLLELFQKRTTEVKAVFSYSLKTTPSTFPQED